MSYLFRWPSYLARMLTANPPQGAMRNVRVLLQVTSSW